MTLDATAHRRRSLRDLARQASAEPLRAPGEDGLLEAARRGDGDARERLIRPHLRVVIDEAVAHRGGDAPLEVLVDAGMMGLLDAPLTYEPSNGPFAAHVRRAVRNGIRARLLSH